MTPGVKDEAERNKAFGQGNYRCRIGQAIPVDGEDENGVCPTRFAPGNHKDTSPRTETDLVKSAGSQFPDGVLYRNQFPPVTQLKSCYVRTPSS